MISTVQKTRASIERPWLTTSYWTSQNEVQPNFIITRSLGSQKPWFPLIQGDRTDKLKEMTPTTTEHEITAPLSKPSSLFPSNFLSLSCLISHHPNAQLLLFLSSSEPRSLRRQRRRELSDRGSRAHRSDHRRSLSTVRHVPYMDTRDLRLRSPLVPQAIFLVPEGASVPNLDFGSDRGGPSRAPHGLHYYRSSLLPGAEMGIHA